MSRTLLINRSIDTDRQVCTYQTISGTGAVHLGANFISRFQPERPQVLISSPTWPNHYRIFTQAGLTVEYYPYFSAASNALDIDSMVGSLRTAHPRSIVVLQPCAHNPTGNDPTQEEWKRIAAVIREHGHFPFFDCAYQGFASGDLLRDSWPVRYFVEQGFELCIAQSFAKNLGLYGERVGAFHFICAPGRDAETLSQQISSQLALLQRGEISNPPSYGARIASCVLNDSELFAQWERELVTMSSRLSGMRGEIQRQLEARKTPGSWGFLASQIGMFSYTGLSKVHIDILRDEWHIYMVSSFPSSMSCTL